MTTTHLFLNIQSICNILQSAEFFMIFKSHFAKCSSWMQLLDGLVWCDTGTVALNLGCLFCCCYYSSCTLQITSCCFLPPPVVCIPIPTLSALCLCTERGVFLCFFIHNFNAWLNHLDRRGMDEKKKNRSSKSETESEKLTTQTQTGKSPKGKSINTPTDISSRPLMGRREPVKYCHT